MRDLLLASNEYLDRPYWKSIYVRGDPIRLFAKAKDAGTPKLIFRAFDLGKALDGFRIDSLAGLALNAFYRSVADEDEVNLVLV